MSKLALVTPKQMGKIAEKCGYFKARQKGSHAIYRNAKGESIVIPMHATDLGRGLIRDTLKDLGISLEEYERLRKEV